MTYTINYKNKLHIFGNYPAAAAFARHWATAEDKRIEITEWRTR